MADPKPTYKIRIIRTSIGDPFLLGEFQFDTDGYSDPSVQPVAGLDIKIEFSTDGNSFPNYGHVSLENAIANWQMAGDGTAARYFFGLPFDPGTHYVAQQAIYLRITMTCSNGTIVMDNGSNNISTFELQYNSTPINLPTVSVYYDYSAS